jgi:hypothetical protein
VRVGAEGGEEDSWGGGDCKPKKQQGRGGDGLVSARRKKLGLGFFMVALNFSL